MKAKITNNGRYILFRLLFLFRVVSFRKPVTRALWGIPADRKQQVVLVRKDSLGVIKSPEYNNNRVDSDDTRIPTAGTDHNYVHTRALSVCPPPPKQRMHQLGCPLFKMFC